MAGYFGGATDAVLMRIADMALSLPFLPFVIVLTGFLGASTSNIVLAVALLLWPNSARVIRSQVLTLRERAYVEAARVTGASSWRILFVHIAPNILPLSFVYAAIAIGWAIITEASVSFLGFGDSRKRVVGLHAAGRLLLAGAVARPVRLVRAARPLHHPGRGRRLLHQPRLRRGLHAEAAWAMTVAMILEVDGLQIHYSTRAGAVRAVDGASFAVPEGRIVGLVGESGCGKTTAVRAIMGVLAENGRRAGGRVIFKGQAIDEAAPPGSCCGATSPMCRKAP